MVYKGYVRANFIHSFPHSLPVFVSKKKVKNNMHLASFACKKWTLFTLCMVEILFTPIVMIVACQIVEQSKQASDEKQVLPERWSGYQVI